MQYSRLYNNNIANSQLPSGFSLGVVVARLSSPPLLFVMWQKNETAYSENAQFWKGLGYLKRAAAAVVRLSHSRKDPIKQSSFTLDCFRNRRSCHRELTKASFEEYWGE